jgi:CRP/FNR family cyclic AMP-dependent transcriptional regulator
MPLLNNRMASSLGLRAVSLLRGLPDSAIEEVSALCTWRRYRKGQQIVARAARDRDVYLVVGGRVRVTAFSTTGRQVTFRDIERGEWFGELAALDGQPRSADVVALEDAVVASVAAVQFRALLHRYPSACDAVLSRLAQSVRELTARVFDLSTLGVQNRLHAEVLRMARAAGVERNTARIAPPPKHADIASQISTYREQVTREISALVRRGLLARSTSALIVRDFAGLEQLVKNVTAFMG